MNTTPEPTTVKASRRQSLIAIFLVVVASIGATATPIAWWVRNSLLETEAFMDLAEPVFTDQEVTTAVGVYVADQAIVALDLEDRLETRLSRVDQFIADGLSEALELDDPARRLLSSFDLPRFADLAVPLAAAAEERIYALTDAFVQSEAFAMALPAGIERAHRAAVALMRGDLGQFENLDVIDGDVVWNAVPAIAATLAELAEERLGVPLDEIELPTIGSALSADQALAELGAALGTELPAGFGQVTVLSEQQLAGWQDLARILDQVVWLLLVLTVLLFIAALVVSPHRRRTLVQLATGTAIGLVVVGVVKRNATEAIIESIVDPLNRGAVRRLVESLFDGLEGLLLVVLALALVVALVAYLLGQPAWLAQLRGAVEGRQFADSGAARFIAAHEDGFIALGLVAAVAAWWVLGIGLWTLLAVGGLLAVYLVAVMFMSRSRRPTTSSTP